MDFKKVLIPSNEEYNWKDKPLPTEYIGFMSSVCFGLDYKSDGKNLLELCDNDEEVLFVFLTEIIKSGFLGKNRRHVTSKTELKNIQKDLEKFTINLKKGEVDSASLGFYGLFCIHVKNKEGKDIDVVLDSQGFEELFLWFEGVNLKITIKDAILIDFDKEASEKSKELCEKVENHVNSLESIPDNLKKELLEKFLLPFRHEDKFSIETQIMFLSIAKKYINIMRGSIWHMVPAKDRIFGGCWSIKESSTLSNKENIFSNFCINYLIDKYI